MAIRDRSSLRTFALGLTVTGIALMAAPARAAEPSGEWLTADRSAQIRIEQCPNGYWGVIDGEREPGNDTKNPDPNKRGRPLLGTPILIAMRPSQPNKWDGKVYNPKEGSYFNISIFLADPNRLKLEGCMLIFCGGETWTRVSERNATTGAAAQPRARSVCPQGGQAQRHN